MIDLHHPLNSLQKGQWFKLICGASLQHLPAVRNLVLAYTLAGADCIDVCADPAVIQAAHEALSTAQSLTGRLGQSGIDLPWLMVSLSDGEDPHFRKAEFIPTDCPVDCEQPCVAICPAQAIVFDRPGVPSGVVEERCYGCGRCLPVCPVQHISTRSQIYPPETIGALLLTLQVDALEIHTQVGRLREFRELWQAIAPYVHRLKLVAVSCPDGEGLINYLWDLYEILSPLPCPLVWQTDGRPMSGDIGAGATRAAVKLGQKVLRSRLPGYVQLAGGTNGRTVAKLRAMGLLTGSLASEQPSLNNLPHQRYIAGIAYGSFARALLSPVFEQLEATTRHQFYRLEQTPELLKQAVSLAQSLVSQLKVPSTLPSDNHEIALPAIDPSTAQDRFTPQPLGMTTGETQLCSPQARQL